MGPNTSDTGPSINSDMVNKQYKLIPTAYENVVLRMIHKDCWNFVQNVHIDTNKIWMTGVVYFRETHDNNRANTRADTRANSQADTQAKTPTNTPANTWANSQADTQANT